MLKMELIFLHLIFVILTCSFIRLTAGENVKKSVDENDTGDANDESLDIPAESEPSNLTCTRRQNSQVHEIRSARSKQFPFMAALMSQQHEYLCSGVVVSNGLILTTGQCTQRPLGYVLLNTTSDKRNETTASLHVIKSEKFPTFTGLRSVKDIGLVYTEKHNSSIASKIKLSNFTDSRNIVDMECIGFGLNAEVGQTKELQYVGVENRVPYEQGDYLRGYFDCVDTKVLTCFKDTGGPVIFDNELIGIVVKGQEDCAKEITATYAVNVKMVDVLPTYTFKAWIDEMIKKNEEQGHVALATFPSKPVRVAPKQAEEDDPLGAPPKFGSRVSPIPCYLVASIYIAFF